MSVHMLRFPLSLAAAFALVATCVGADDRKTPESTTRVQVQENGAKSEEGLSGSAHRASKLIGMNVQNKQGEELGEIEDLVVDMRSGRIRYAAVSHGGFLDIGDKMFAVPWNALQVAAGKDGDRLLVLDIDKNTLKNAPGFNDDNWPDFASREFVNKIETFYRPLTEKNRQPREGVKRPRNELPQQN